MIGESLQVAAAVATLAAISDAPDAVTRGDLVAERLLEEGLWPLTRWAAYQGRPAEQRKAYWASGELVLSMDYQPSVKQLVKEAYESHLGFLLPGSSGYLWWKAWDEGGLNAQLPDLGIPNPFPALMRLAGFGVAGWLAIQLLQRRS